MSDKPLIVAPAVSVIVAEMARRPCWEIGRPFSVPEGLYAAARDEMSAIMEKRGFRLVASSDVKQSNFLILGTPIVAHG